MKKTYLILVGVALIMCNTVDAATLNLKLYIEGYYLGSGQMQPVMYNEGVAGALTTQTDTIVVELHDSANASIVVASFQGVLLVDGTIACTFPNSVIGNSYYIAVRHRSAIQTWSAAPLSMSATTSYDFSSAQTQAYDNYMVRVDISPDTWAFYIGDINQDGNIDQIDWPPFDIAGRNSLFGYYATDLNGDGNNDVLDFQIMHDNCVGIYSHHP